MSSQIFDLDAALGGRPPEPEPDVFDLDAAIGAPAAPAPARAVPQPWFAGAPQVDVRPALSRAWEAVNRPFRPVTAAARGFAGLVDRPEFWASQPEPVRTIGAATGGALAGAAEAVAGQATPVNVASLALGGGAAAFARAAGKDLQVIQGLVRAATAAPDRAAAQMALQELNRLAQAAAASQSAARGLQAADVALSAPQFAEGVALMNRGAQEGDESKVWQGIGQLALGVGGAGAGLSGLRRPRVRPVSAEAIRPGALTLAAAREAVPEVSPSLPRAQEFIRELERRRLARAVGPQEPREVIPTVPRETPPVVEAPQEAPGAPLQVGARPEAAPPPVRARAPEPAPQRAIPEPGTADALVPDSEVEPMLRAAQVELAKGGPAQKGGLIRDAAGSVVGRHGAVSRKTGLGLPVSEFPEPPKRIARAIEQDADNPIYLRAKRHYKEQVLEQQDARARESGEPEGEVDTSFDVAELEGAPRDRASAVDQTPAGEQRRLEGTIAPQSRPTIRTEGREAEGPLFTQERDAAVRAEERSQGGLFDDETGAVRTGGGRFRVKVPTGEEGYVLGMNRRGEFQVRLAGGRVVSVKPEQAVITGGPPALRPTPPGRQPAQRPLFHQPRQPGAPPPAPPTPPTPAEPRSFFRRLRDSVSPSLEVVGRLKGADGSAVGRRLQAISRSFFRDWEVPASRRVGAYERAIRGLGDTEFDDVVKVLEGQYQGQAPPKVARAAGTIRQLLDGLAADATQADVFVGYRRDYFPHVWAREGFDFQKVAQKISSEEGISLNEATRRLNRLLDKRRKTDPNLERIRRDLDRAGYRRDRDVLREYFVEATRHVSEARHFGHGLARADKLVNQIPAGADREYAQKAIARYAHREPSTVASRISHGARQFEAASKLGLGAITQTTSASQIVAEVGAPNFVRAMRKVLADPRSAEINAISSGSLFSHIANEFNETVGKNKRALYGVPSTDRWLRVVADAAGEFHLKELLRQKRWKDLRTVGIRETQPWVRDLLDKGRNEGWDAVGAVDMDPDALARLSRHLADTTQFRTGVQHLPLAWSSPLGRAMTQFMGFMHAHARWINRLTGETLKGNAASAAKLGRFAVTGGLILGEAANDAKAVLRGYGVNLTDDEEPEWADIFKGQRIGWNHPAKRILQNLAQVGGLGLYQTVLERIVADQDITGFAGPAIQDVARLYQRAAKPAVRGEFGKAGRAAGRFVAEHVGGLVPGRAGERLRSVPGIPNLAAEAGREAFAERLPAEPGLVGRARDVVSPETAYQRAKERRRLRQRETNRRRREANP